MKLRTCLWVVAACALLAACNPFTPTYTYRYRITVEVDTPQGLRNGSSVWEVRQWRGSGIPNRGIRSRVRGEAVAVDLPDGTLFALLRGADTDVDYLATVVYRHLINHPTPGLPMDLGPDGFSKNMRAIIRTKPVFQLDANEYPLLVRFRDINNPASVEKVDPSDLAAKFGPGVRIRRLTVAVTEDDVTTTGIERRFIWWERFRGLRFDGTSTVTENLRHPTLQNALTIGSFSTEV